MHSQFDAYLEDTRALNQQLAQMSPLRYRTAAQIMKIREMETQEWEGPSNVHPDNPNEPAVDLPIEQRTVTTTYGDVPVRIIRPPRVAAVYMDIHGGGGVTGKAMYKDAVNCELACAVNVAVVSVDYRRAPEHLYPAGVDDCVGVASWLAQNAAPEFGTHLLLIGGESAGAYYSALTLLWLRELGLLDHYMAAQMEYGSYDLSLTPSVLNAATDSLVIDRESIEGAYASMLGDIPLEQRRVASISPLYADLRGLPPALFSVGTFDPLLDDSLFMAARWQAAGNEAELYIFSEATHGFTMMPTATARYARRKMYDWLRQHIAAQSSAAR